MNDEDTKFNRRFLALLTLLLTVSALGYIFAITFATVPKDNSRFADTILGFLLGTLLGTVVSFFYGSSKSSQNKDQTASSVVKALTADAPVEELK